MCTVSLQNLRRQLDTSFQPVRAEESAAFRCPARIVWAHCDWLSTAAPCTAASSQLASSFATGRCAWRRQNGAVTTRRGGAQFGQHVRATTTTVTSAGLHRLCAASQSQRQLLLRQRRRLQRRPAWRGEAGAGGAEAPPAKSSAMTTATSWRRLARRPCSRCVMSHGWRPSADAEQLA